MTMTTTTTTATPTKLRNGSWGATVRGSVQAGDTITITTRAGKRWDARVERVIWTGPSKDGGGTVAICATSSLGQQQRTRSKFQRRGRAYYQDGIQVACGYPCPVTGRTCTPDHPCHDCL